MTEKIGCVQHDCPECVARQRPEGPLISTALAEQQFGRYFRQGYDEGVRAQRTWVGLTDEERGSVLDSVPPDNMGGEYYDKEITAIALAIEAKLKEKNT